MCKSFGPQSVLTGVDLVVAEGSFAAVLGPSGSGKTTLLRLLVGFDRPDAGSVWLRGRLVDGPGRHAAPERRKIGYVPQEGGLFPHLSVEANIRFGMPRSARRTSIDALVDLVGLGDLLARYPHQLSGGQQQRVALTRALAIQPDLVLLDEPFSSLDAALRASVRSDVRRLLAQTGTTALLVTHDQDEALSLADQVAVLRAGRIAQQSTPADLYRLPVDPSLARFVGDGNFVRGVVSGGRVRSCLGDLALAAVAASSLSDGQAALTLVRPEQLVVAPGSRGVGIAGRVIRTNFHGHDTVVTVEPGGLAPSAGPMADDGCFLVRLAGGDLMAPGTEVTVTATGEVMAWPA